MHPSRLRRWSLAGNDCITLGFDGGTLACDPTCTFDLAGCFVCGDGSVDPGEQCDGADLAGNDCVTLGFDDGTLACAPDCSYDTTGCIACGNGAAEPGEQCDGADLAGSDCVTLGFDGGTLAYDLACTFDPSGCFACGDGSVDPGEQCDGANLAGNDCVTLGLDGGTLACGPACAFDLSGCTACGDGSVDPGEQCDGADLAGSDCVTLGFDGGALACDPACTFDPSGCTACGDGSVDPGEQCDGANLDGETCVSLGFGGGMLGCDPSCTFDTTACVTGVPPAQASLLLWLRGDAGIVTDPAGVTTWEDQSASFNDATQLVDAEQPQFVANAINGLPAVRFLGNDRLALDANLGLGEMTIGLVAQSNHPGENFHMILGPGPVNHQLRYNNSTELLIVGSGFPTITSPIGDNTVYHSLTIRYSGAAWEIWRDGVLASSDAAGPGDSLTLGTIGAWFGQHWFIGEIAEILVYDVSLTDPERVNLEDYLRTKYALP